MESSEGNASTSMPNDDEIKNPCPHTENPQSLNVTDSSNAGQQNTTTETTATNIGESETTAPSQSETSSATTITSSSLQAKPFVQTVLQNRFVKTTKAQAEKITVAIAYLIAVACLAYSFVENVGFRHLMNIVAPNYQVPSRKVFSDDRIPKLYQATKAKICGDLKNIENFGLTTDGWTSSNSHKVIAVTVSFINENWQLVCRTLACRDLNISNTG